MRLKTTLMEAWIPFWTRVFHDGGRKNPNRMNGAIPVTAPAYQERTIDSATRVVVCSKDEKGIEDILDMDIGTTGIGRICKGGKHGI
jgi:hypothetical protein